MGVRDRQMFVVGAGLVGVAVGAVLMALADDRPPTTRPDDPEIAMPAPSVDFEDLAVEPPPAVASATTITTTVAVTTVGAPRTLRLSGAMTLEVRFSPLDEDRRADYTLTGTFFGDMTGEWVEEGTEQYGDVDAEGHVRSVGSGTATAQLTVPGVGTGRVESTNDWHSDNQGSVLGISTITSGSGDLEGVTGTMRWNSTDDAGTITYQLDLTVP